jgi:hypothetical protein
VRRLTGRIVVASVAGLVVCALGSPALANPGAVVSDSRSSRARAALSGPGHVRHRGTKGEVDVNLCSASVGAGLAHCDAHIRTDLLDGIAEPQPREPSALGGPVNHAAVGNAGAYDPAYLQSAYDAPSATNGTGQTVAIVDAFDAPHVESDLATYRARFGLPACTTADGCFKKVDQHGGTAYPAFNAGWAEEIALDVQMVSALCPQCHILLVEATSNNMANLGAAVNKAVELGANVVSNSYGGPEWSSETVSDAQYFDHPGVAMVASTGDGGYGVNYPAASPDVVAVGGTTLYQNTYAGTRNGTETAWSGAGSGCSAYEPKPAWQTDSDCANRTVADVSAVADPATGVWVYSSDAGGWVVLGGTSVAAPIVGALYALAGNGSSTTDMGSLAYASPGALTDVVSGSNGSCGGSYLCAGAVGYDGPTGLGTPLGVGAFTPGGVPVGGGAPPPPPPPPAPAPAPAADFTISASAVGPLRPGATARSTVTVTPTNGFSGTVKLSAPTTPSVGLARRYNSSTLAINGGARTATLILTAKSAGKYSVNVTATRGALVHKVALKISVNDFSLRASPGKTAVTRGTKIRFSVSVAAAGSFNGAVVLSVSGLRAHDTVIYGRNPVSAPGRQVITISTSALDPRQTLVVRIKGVSGSLDHAITVVLTVQ